MIWSFVLFGRNFRLPVKWLVAGVLVIGATALIALWYNGKLSDAKESGRQEVVEQVESEVIDHVDTANKARQDADRDPAVRNADCLRNARNPEDCE